MAVWFYGRAASPALGGLGNARNASVGRSSERAARSRWRGWAPEASAAEVWVWHRRGCAGRVSGRVARARGSRFSDLPASRSRADKRCGGGARPHETRLVAVTRVPAHSLAMSIAIGTCLLTYAIWPALGLTWPMLDM